MEVVQHQLDVSPHVPFRVELRGLWDPVHPRHLGQDLMQQARFEQQLHAAGGAAFG